ncbi:MAG: major facilitator superfamily 1 [Solirubrobacterales bacterium]|nr:major facilitator superfamily 1 [Solirubrobacterales bacterium]
MTCNFGQVADARSLTPARQRLLLGAVVSGLLLAMLDQTIVGTALPSIVRSLDGADLYVWVVTAYLVPATVSLPIYARLSDRYGRRALLLVGMVLFLAGSAAAATSQTMGQLIAWRALQGAGAGALEGLSFILVADLYGGRRNAAVQGLLAGLMGVSFIAGPLIGGLLTDKVGWRWVFLVNLPIGAVALTVVAGVLPRSIGRSEARGTPLDLKGIAVLTAAVGALLIGLNEHSRATAAGTLPAWTDLRCGGLVLLGFALVPVFVAIERRAAAPIVPLRLLADRRVAAILAAAATAMFGLFAGVLLLPRYFQTVRDVSATQSGLLIYPLLLGLLLSANIAPALIVRLGAYRGILLGACGVTALGALGFATFDAGTPDWQALIFMGLLGAGIGPAVSGLQVALMRTVAPRDIGGAMGTMLLLRQVGGAIALAAAETLYATGVHHDGLGSAATATGSGVLVVTLCGTAVSAVALLSLPRGAGRLPAPAVPAPA